MPVVSCEFILLKNNEVLVAGVAEKAPLTAEAGAAATDGDG